ncbi:MAG: serine/threonine protein kinase, partial [Proteobacteria bacterium]|nr:serine/threonine protein kinase [Pseudomonadota bacterium]
MSAVVRALEIFSQAVECDAATREAYLDAACGDDAALRTQVEHMLHADACDGAFLEQPLIAAESDRRGERVGAYRLDALIGSGGMGSVYRAARADGAFDKPVAIKLLAFDVGDLR